MILGLIITPLMFFTSPGKWFSVPILEILILSIIVLGVYAQVYRYRYVSNFSQRQQTKWVLFGFLLFVGMILITYPFFIFISNTPPGESLPWWTPLGNIIWWLTMCIMPVTIFIAIQRHSLWDIDLIIRKTLVYGAITLLLALVYFGSVVLLQQAFRALTGQDSPVAIVISTLVLAALFNPLRSQIQEIIDRRFYRGKYDAQQALAEFAASARDEVELDQLTGHLLSVVQESMQPEQASLWLRAGEKK
jgi:divalent metal cation (Fe/Co/Zn/Cd) transporter